MTSSEIKESIAELDERLTAARCAIVEASIIDARAHFDGAESNASETARANVTRLLDIRAGAQIILLQTEIETIEAELKEREPRLAELSKRVAELRATSADENRLRYARTGENDAARAQAYGAYERANIELLRLSGEKQELEARSHELSRRLGEALRG